MRLKGFIAISAIVLLGLNNCSDHSQSNQASLSDVSMPSESGPQVLLWAAEGKIFKGQCTDTVPRRETCNQNVVSKPRLEVIDIGDRNATAELTKLAKDRADEITRIKAQDPTALSLAAQIKDLRIEEVALDKESKALQTDLTADNTEKSKNEKLSQWYAEQITAISARLVAAPTDRDLLRLLEQTRQEKDVVDGKIQDLSGGIALNTGRLTQANKLLADVKVEISALTTELNAYLNEIVLNSDVLINIGKKVQDAQAAKDSIERVITFIESSDITYRSALLTASEQKALNYLSVNWVASVTLNAGRYKVTAGHSSYCPQAVLPAYEASVLKRVKVSFLSPCSGGSDLACTNNNCVSGSVSLVVKSPISYEFKSGSLPIGTFSFQSALALETFEDMTPSTGVFQE